MKMRLEDRFIEAINPHNYPMDLHMWLEGILWTSYNPERLSKKFMKIAENMLYDEDSCNYRLFEWIYETVKMAEQLTGLRGGNISGKQLYETVRKIVPDYENENPTYLDAAAALKGEVRKAVQRSIEAKKQFLVSEQPKAYSDMAALIGANFDEALYSRAIWAHSEELEEIEQSNIQNEGVIRALFKEYDDLCHPGSEAALKDALIRYNDSLCKLKEDVVFSEIARTLAKVGKAKKPYLPESALKQVEKHLEAARKHKSDIRSALADSEARRISDIEEYDIQMDALAGIEWQIEKSGSSEELREGYQKILARAEQLRESFDPVKKASIRKEKREKAAKDAKKEIIRLKKEYDYQLDVLDTFDAQIEAHGLTDGMRSRYLRVLGHAEGLHKRYEGMEGNLHSEPEDTEDGLKDLQELIVEQDRDFERIKKDLGKVQLAFALGKEGIKDYIIGF